MLVADLRAAVGRRGVRDPKAQALADDLMEISPDFAAVWAANDVRRRRADRKRLKHAELGMLEVDCLNLLSEDGRQRLLWFAPTPGTDSKEKLELLSVVGH